MQHYQQMMEKKLVITRTNDSGEILTNCDRRLQDKADIKNSPPQKGNNKRNLKEKKVNNDITNKNNITGNRNNIENINKSNDAMSYGNIKTNGIEEHTMKYPVVYKKAENADKKPCVYKKLIVLDYDDTILPTSWITLQNKLTLYDTIPSYMQQLFMKLSGVVIHTLKLCLMQGIIVIVTNASLEWLVNSAKKYIPLVWNFIVYHKIRIISARDRLINTLVNSQNWKRVIFHHVVNEILSPYLHDDSFMCCVYSVGDGNDERNACFAVSQMDKYSSCVFKSLKFLSEPTCEKLIAEHEMLRFFLNNGYTK